MEKLYIIYIVISILWIFTFGIFAGVSYFEREKRAALRSLLFAIFGGLFFFLGSLLPETIQLICLLLIGLITLSGVVLFLLPIGKVSIGVDTPLERYDERDIMFARARLKPGSQEFESYYQMRPENKVIDDRTRAKAGLLSKDSRLSNPYLFASPSGSFFLTENLSGAVEGPVSGSPQTLPPKEMTNYLKNLALYYGALHVGVAELKPYHVYSHIGRGSGTYGDPISIDHKYAIAFTVEMDYQMMGVSPEAQVVMESGKEYVESARVAVQLAAAIRALGYPARAHIDGNYRVIAPLVARDAGLGELGRMGLLMTPTHGPRVRLGVVTTEIELLVDGRQPDSTIIDFCSFCRKCAENCPSRSIPFDERKEIDGVLRWQIDAETCFHYWNVIGTDCGRCMAVCPYSHPATWSHNVIRWGNARSGSFRRAVNWLDDFFYGKQPERRDAPDWTDIPEPTRNERGKNSNSS